MWVALLRGINVGRNKRLAMADLRALLESLGYRDVRTLLQSGNALFITDRGRGPVLERAIASRISADLGMDVKVLVRRAAELGSVVDANPFMAPGVDVSQLHAAFVSAAPPASAFAALHPADFAPDEFAVGDRVLYLRTPDGVRASRLPDWERLLGLAVTVRTWNTVTRLHALASG